MKCYLAMLLLATCALPLLPAAAKDKLFDGEIVTKAASYPAIYQFIAGDKDKPLLVFVPGAHHTARVFYGGHEGYHPKDFIAYWVKQKGYNFLALSYPIALAQPAIPTNHPDFTIRDWGKQTAALAKMAIKDNGLKNNVIVVGWSMGGKISQSVYAAMNELDINLMFYVALTATPPLPGLIALERQFPMLDSGYTDRRKNFAGWFAQVKEQGEGLGRDIVPESVFMAQYVGDIPINLQGYGEQYRDGKFVMDSLAVQQDSQAFNFAAFPLVGIIAPNSRVDSRHAVVDKASWGIYNANTVYNRYIAANKVDLSKLSETQWQGVLALTRDMNNQLFTSIDGNHFFFMGEQGAQATANAIEQLEGKVSTLKADFSRLLDVAVK